MRLNAILTIQVLTFVVMAMFLTGCPMPTVSTDPVEPPVTQGTVVMEGNLHQLVQGSDLQKSLSPGDWMELVNIQIPKVTSVQMMFVDPRTHELRGYTEQPVVNGFFRVTQKLNPGSYTMYGNFWGDGSGLFSFQQSFEVKAGLETRVEVAAVLSSMCRAGFILDDMFPAAVKTATSFSITRINGRGAAEVFSGSLTSSEEGLTRAEIWLPWDFDGGQMDIICSDGQIVSSAAWFNWLWMSSGRDWVLQYNPQGEISVTFDFWWPGRVLGNGTDYDSIQKAVDANAGGMADIKLGPGGYEVSTIVVPPGTRVSIIGVVGQTQIYTREGCAVHASEIPGNAAKGGGSYVVLRNLDVVASGAGSGYYYDAAVFVEAMGLTITNCSIRAPQNRAVVTNYSSWTYMEHCVVQSSGEGVVVYNGNQQGNEVHASIFLGCSVGVDAETEGGIYVQKCSFWKVGRMANFEFDAASDNLGIDPRFIFDPFETWSNFRLAADSPLIGAAGDGSDIGLDF